MSLSAMLWALDAPIDKPTAKLTLVCICDHANKTGYCFPSQKELAERVGCTTRAIRSAIIWLEENGYISRSERSRKDGSRTSDEYQLPDQAYRKNFPMVRNDLPVGEEISSGLTTFEPVNEPVNNNKPAEKNADQQDFELYVLADYPKSAHTIRKAAWEAYRKLSKPDKTLCIGGIARYSLRFEDEYPSQELRDKQKQYVIGLQKWIKLNGWEKEYEQ